MEPVPRKRLPARARGVPPPDDRARDERRSGPRRSGGGRLFPAARGQHRPDSRAWARARRRTDSVAARTTSCRGPRPLRPRPGGSGGRMTFEEARAQFPVLERFAYLNAGSNGPLPRAAVAAAQARLERDLAEGRSGMVWVEEIREMRERIRGGIAAVLGTAAELVALT